MKALRNAHFEGKEGLTKRRVLDVARIDGATATRTPPQRFGMIVYDET